MKQLKPFFILIMLYSFGLLGASSALGLSCNGGDVGHAMIGTAITLVAALFSSVAFGYSLANSENRT